MGAPLHRYADNPATRGCTHTCEGTVPYKRMLWRGYIIDAPVAVVVDGAAPWHREHLPAPLRDSDGGLVYALPCGEFDSIEYRR